MSDPRHAVSAARIAFACFVVTMLCASVVGRRLRARRPTTGRRCPPRRRAPRLGHRARGLGPLVDAPGPVRPGTPRARQLRRRAGRTRGDARASGGHEPAAAADRRAGRCAGRARDRGAVPHPIARARARATRCCARHGVAACAPITDDGRPVRARDVPLDGLVTVFPEGHPGLGRRPGVLMRVEPERLQLPPGARRLGARRAHRVLEGLHARRLPGRAVRAEHRSSCCARATSRRSTCSTAPSPCSGPRPRALPAAAARDRRRRLRRRAERLPRADRPELLEPPRERARPAPAGRARGRGRRSPRRAVAAGVPSSIRKGSEADRDRRRLVADVRARRRGLRRRRRLHRRAPPCVVDAGAAGRRACSDNCVHLDRRGRSCRSSSSRCSRSSPSTTTSALRKPAPDALRIDVVGQAVVVGGPLPGHRRRHRQRDPRPASAARSSCGLDSDNVIHSFWVPQLAGKIDTDPRPAQRLRFTRRHAGHATGASAPSSAASSTPTWASSSSSSTPADFDRWLARREPRRRSSRRPRTAAAGELVFLREPCAGCHTIAGTDAQRHGRPRPHRLRRAPHARRATRRRTRRANLARLDRRRAGDQARRPRCRRSDRCSTDDVRRARRLPREPEVVTVDRRSPTSRRRRVERRSSERWEDAPGHPRLLHHRRPQAHRHALHLHRVRLLLPRRPRCAGHARPARAAEQQRARRPETYNELFTMHGTTMIFLFNTPVLAGLRQLPVPLHARQPRHGVPAAERVQLLDLPVRRAASCTRASSSASRPTAAGSPTCRSPARRTRPASTSTSGGSASSSSASRRRSARSTSSSRSSSCARRA